MIDEDSREAIEQAMEALTGKENRSEVFSGIVVELARWFFDTPSEELRKQLKEKMTKGAKEHGPVTRTQCKEEIKEEYLDLFGWTLRGRFSKE